MRYHFIAWSICLLASFDAPSHSQIIFDGDLSPFNGDGVSYESRISNGAHEILEFLSFEDDLLVYVEGCTLNIVVLDESYSMSDPIKVDIPDAYITGIARVDDHLYISSNCDAVYVVDVSTPTSPALMMRNTLGPTKSIHRYERLIITDNDILEPSGNGLLSRISAAPTGTYVGADEETAFWKSREDGTDVLSSYSMSDPASPTYLGSIALHDGARVSTEGHYAFVNWTDLEGGQHAMEIFDVSDPMAMKLTASLPRDKFYHSVVHKEWYLYCAGHRDIDIYYVRDMSNPSHVGTHDTPSVSRSIHRNGRRLAAVIEDTELSLLAMRGPELAVVSGGTFNQRPRKPAYYTRQDYRIAVGRQIYSLVDPESPSLVRTLPYYAGWRPIELFYGNYCYSQNRVYDLSQPEGSEYLGYNPDLRFSRYSGTSDGKATIVGDRMYCLIRNGSPTYEIQLRTLSLAGPASPTLTSELTLLSGVARSITSFCVSGDSLYVVSDEGVRGGHILVVDIGGAAPRLVHIDPTSSDTRIHGIHGWRGKLYILGTWHGADDQLVVIDPSYSYDTPISSLDVPGRMGWEFDGWGPYMATGGQNGDGILRIIDGTDPLAPEVLAQSQGCSEYFGSLVFEDGIVSVLNDGFVLMFRAEDTDDVVPNLVSMFRAESNGTSIVVSWNVSMGSDLGLSRIVATSENDSRTIAQRYFGQGPQTVVDNTDGIYPGARIDYELQVVNHDETWHTVSQFLYTVPELRQVETSISAVPNPFNPRTTIRFTTDRTDRYRIGIFSMDGRRVRTLGTLESRIGVNSVVWDGESDDGQTVAAGAYFVRIDGPSRALLSKILLLK